jgi:hypothetical protein
MEVIAEESKKVTDVAATSATPAISSFGAIFNKILSALSIGIFKSPPFSLENIFPSVNFFKNKYFKLVSMLIIYLGLMGFILNAYKPKDTKNMIIVYSICFWIALMAFSIAVVNPYDENSVEYMLKDKVISKMKEMDKGPDDKDAKQLAPELPLSEQSEKSTEKSTKTSYTTIIMAVILMVFFGGLQIYSFLNPLGV